MTQFPRLRTHAARLASVTLITGLVSVPAVPASAQQVQAGATTEVATLFARGVDTAFDPNTNTYLIVGGQGTLVGRCINASGVPTSGIITINNTGWGQFPRARYSPLVAGSGGFLVTWPEEVGAIVELHARTVTCSGALGAEQVISGGHTAWLESGAALDYSSSSQRFLVAWKSFPPNVRIKATLVDNTGARVSGVVDLSPEFGRDPGVAWNPFTNQFGVSFNGENGDGSVSYSGFAVVPASNPAAFARTTFNIIPGSLITISDVDFNTATGRYLMTWFELSSGVYAKVAEFDGGGNLISSGIASHLVGSYDALSIGYNPVSGTFLLAGVDRRNDATIGVELNSRGFPFNGENTLSATHRESWYTRVTSSSLSRTWNSVFTVRKFAGIGSVIATSFAANGGPAGAHGGGGGTTTPPPPPPPTTGCTTVQPGPGWTCVNGNWLPPSDPTTPPPPGSSCTTVSPGPGWTCVNGNWLPPTSGTSSCTTVSPGPGWTCVNGNWLPPTTSTSSCTTVSPGPGWRCVNGNWLPPTTTTSSCTTIQPGPGWTCVNGNWLPTTSTSSCTTISPGPGWTCVNGNWLPGTSTGGGGGGGCSTVQPGPGWICVNGGWVPPDSPLAPSSCPTVRPGPGWVCVSGNWLPPDSPQAATLSPTSSCPGAPPAAGWVCISGNWVPPDHPMVTGG